MNTKLPITVNFWLFVTVVLAGVTGTSCFTNLGLFCLSCKASVSITLVWILLSAGVAVVAAANLVPDRPGE